MIAGISPDPVTKSLLGLTSYLYGPPSALADQFTQASVFNAGQYLSSLFFPSNQPTELNPPPAYFVEINALGILKDSLAPVQSDPGSFSDGLSRLLIGRLWPSDVQPAQQADTGSLNVDTGALIGQLLDTVG